MKLLHIDSSLLSLYSPILENSVVILMNYDEIKSFSFLKQYSLQELYFSNDSSIIFRKWFWELYSHCQFIYEKINKTVKVLFNIIPELSPAKKVITLKAISDLCKECQPDLQLVEVFKFKFKFKIIVFIKSRYKFCYL